MRTLLHLYPEDAPQRASLLRRKAAWLREHGLRLVLADEQVEASDEELYHDALRLPPHEDVGGALARLLPFARSHRIAGIVAQTEWAAPAGSLLACILELPGPSPEATLRCLGKHRTREALARAAIPQPDFALARSARDVARFAAEHGFPVVLKALASTMARLVAVVEGEAGIEPAVARLLSGLARSSDVARLESFARAANLDLGADPRSTFLCEAFAPGDAVEVDGLVAGGRTRTFGVIEQALAPPPGFFLEGYLLPSDRPDSQLAAIEEVAARAVAAVGLDHAGFSIEMRADSARDSGDEIALASGAPRSSSSGPAARARVIEVNGRLGEDDGLHRLFELSSGADPFELSLAVASGESAQLPAPPGSTALAAPDRRACGTDGGRPATKDAGPTPGTWAASRLALAYRCSFEEGIVREAPGAADLAALKRGALRAARPGSTAASRGLADDDAGGAKLVDAGVCVRPGQAMHAPPHPDVFPHLAWALARHPTSSRAAFARARDLLRRLPFTLVQSRSP